MNRILDVYLNDQFVGLLIQDSRGDLSFSYDVDYMHSSQRGISVSLPLRSEEYKGAVVRAFFSGLLPDQGVREQLAGILGLSKDNSFALLESVGGECAGALGLYPHGEKPAEYVAENEELDEIGLKKVLDSIRRRPMLAGDDGFRLSLEGAQNKLAVVFKNGKVYLIRGGAPTTHILKPMIQGIKDSAHNELFCMRLAKHVGIDVPHASIYFAHETPYYIVERYDRFIDHNGKITRIHQEDFCQALGIAPEMKYEREGGPNIKMCQEIIAQHVARPAVDKIKLLNIIIFNYLIGNADAHGKNISLL